MRQKYVHKFHLSNLIVAELTTAKREDLLAKLQMHEFNLAEPFSPTIIRPTRARGPSPYPSTLSPPGLLLCVRANETVFGNLQRFRAIPSSPPTPAGAICHWRDGAGLSVNTVSLYKWTG